MNFFVTFMKSRYCSLIEDLQEDGKESEH